jgi:hypothetical protein
MSAEGRQTRPSRHAEPTRANQAQGLDPSRSAAEEQAYRAGLPNWGIRRGGNGHPYSGPPIRLAGRPYKIKLTNDCLSVGRSLKSSWLRWLLKLRLREIRASH